MTDDRPARPGSASASTANPRAAHTNRAHPAAPLPQPGDDLGRGSPGLAARGRGPNRPGDISQEDDHAPSAGWGAARSVTKVLARTREPLRGPKAVVKMNHE